jgi:hypothetical protein
MAWETGSTTGTNVVSIHNGEEKTYSFEGTKLLKEVVQSVASQMGFGSVLVKADGRDVQPDEGDKAISSFSRIEVVPKHSGANE